MGCDIQDVVDNGLGQLSWATLMCTRYYQDGFKVGSFALIQFTAEEMIDVIDVTPNLVNLQQYNSKVAIQSPKCAA
ncbi:hypothetical protein FACS1894166_11390 [Bacilli bacterium]|nr:hypothetical protein FACS1894166_11390 [Bacilli bacterium]